MKSLTRTNLLLLTLTCSLFSLAQNPGLKDDTVELDDGQTGMEELAANSQIIMEEREIKASQKNDDMVLAAVDQEVKVYQGKHEKTAKIYIIRCTENPLEIDLETSLTEDLQLDSTQMARLKSAIRRTVEDINKELEALEDLIHSKKESVEVENSSTDHKE